MMLISLALAQEPANRPPPDDLAPLVLASSVSAGCCAGGAVGCCGCLPGLACGLGSGAFLASVMAPDDPDALRRSLGWGAAGAVGGVVAGTLGSIFFYALFLDGAQPQWAGTF